MDNFSPKDRVKLCRETIKQKECAIPCDCGSCFIRVYCFSAPVGTGENQSVYAAREYLEECGILDKIVAPIVPDSPASYSSGIIETSTGDMIPTAYIDEIGTVKESVYPKTIYRKILFWDIAWEQEDAVDGYYFLIHTIGGVYGRVSRKTKEESEKVRRELLDAISGVISIMDAHR